MLRTTVVLLTLLVGLTACGDSEAKRRETCRLAIDGTSTNTQRPRACQDLGVEEYTTLRSEWARKNAGVIGPADTAADG
ncbi:hypothetical protein [Streptomyces omiyaensis]|nr:hypothetical protein [Streptomyces omiyaensis]GGY80431.1 hypothetical protein GCM10010363_71650 [Streptomyces omiyaensis]